MKNACEYVHNAIKELTTMKSMWIEYNDCGTEGLWFYGEHSTEEKARAMAGRNGTRWCTFEEAEQMGVQNLPY